ncbi:MAG: RdgB/HAM1 family non-canonical purine NTP pyrophosphatase [Anaerolineales bacterium]|nr:RdgB/HAM1 family non-canonical purine NTP pyrophosphatase [Anaerolineales bacterium]
MMNLLIATFNPGKVLEYDKLLAGLEINCVGPADLGLDLDVTESGVTFLENATLKAVAFARAGRELGIDLTLADDSGLEVDALDGRPGVHSARFGGPGLTDADRWILLLEELGSTPWHERTARFRCTIGLATPDEQVTIVDGVLEGFIAYQPAGSNGFGYDPIFYLPDLDCTLAQLESEEKNRISHRGNAARSARPIILQYQKTLSNRAK